MKKNHDSGKSLKKRNPIFLPILGLILLPLGCILLQTVFDQGVMLLGGEATFGIWEPTLAAVLAGALCLFIHKGWYAGDYEGSLKFRNFGKGFLLLLPCFAFVALNLLGVKFSSLTADRILAMFVSSIAPGFIEEVAFRGLAGANFMRAWRDEKKIVLAATLTSIVFAAAHLVNLSQGAGLYVTLTQILFAFGAGVIFSAVFFRTGSLLPSIAVHTLVDFTCFLNPGGDGVMTDNGAFDLASLVLGVLSIILGVLGYYYLRPAKRAEILDIWKKKWNLDKADTSAEEVSAD